MIEKGNDTRPVQLLGGGDADAFSEGSALGKSHYSVGGNILTVNDSKIRQQIKYTKKYIEADLPDPFVSSKFSQDDM